MAAEDPILVVGGGLGGLTTAVALARLGRTVRVLEGAPEFGAIGYGIQFGPNVFHALDRVGLSEQMLAVADSPAAVLMLDALSGDEVVRIPTAQSFRRRFRHPYIVVHRVDAHNVLLEACRHSAAIELVPDAVVTGFEDSGSRVTVATADGRGFSGAALVAADGLRSLFRQHLVGDGEPRPSGYAAHRTIVPMTALDAQVSRDCVVLWGGPGFHIVHYPLRRGTLFNVVAVFRTPTHAQKGDLASHLAELAHHYRDAHPAMHALLAMVDAGRRWQVCGRDPVRRWHKGRVVLLGDAAHPPLQSLAQGACMAIEDAICLAELIAGGNGDFPAAFRQFEAARLLRTARVQLESRAIWEFYHAEGIAREVRNAAAADWDEAHMFDCLSWLYDGFQTPADPAS